MILSPHEIADLAIKAGFSKTTVVAGTTDSEAIVAVAIALAESGGNTDTISRTTAPLTSDPKSVGNRDHGLFQLSGRWQYPKIQAAGGRWRDPVVNTAIAYEIFKGAKRSFTPWMAFTKNASGVAPFEQFLPDARLGVAQPWPCSDSTTDALSRYSGHIANLSTSMLELSKKVEVITAELAAVRKHFS